MGTNDEKAGGFSVEAGQNVADGEKITQAFGHFFVIAGDKAIVHPDARQGLPTGPFTLRNLVLVVRKLQVSTAAMNIDRIAQ